MSRNIVRFVNFVFLTISCLLFLLLLTISVNAILSGDYTLKLNEDGFNYFQNFWKRYSILLKGFATSATIFIAGYNLSKYIDIAALESLSKIRSKFNESGKKDFHLFMMKDEYIKADKLKSETDYALAQKIIDSNPEARDNTFDSADVLDYLGIVELGYIMYRKGIIDMDEFHRQFGYRVEYLLENDVLVGHINANSQYYEDFIGIVTRLYEGGKIPLQLYNKIKS